MELLHNYYTETGVFPQGVALVGTNAGGGGPHHWPVCGLWQEISVATSDHIKREVGGWF